MVVDLAMAKLTVSPYAFIGDAIITNQVTLAMVGVVFECTNVLSSVGEFKRALAVVQAVLKLACVGDSLADFIALSVCKVV